MLLQSSSTSSYHILSSSLSSPLFSFLCSSHATSSFLLLLPSSMPSPSLSTPSQLSFLSLPSISSQFPLKPPSTLSRPSLQVHPVLPSLSKTIYIIGPLGIFVSLCFPSDSCVPLFAVHSPCSLSHSIQFPLCSQVLILVPLFHSIVCHFTLVFP
jgi:hypothetical protein